METNRNNILDIYSILSEMFPDARCELNYNNVFELTISTILSAQTTDISVNKVTPLLFSRYPDAASLYKAEYDDICLIIKSIGLYKAKAKNIINLSKVLIEKYQGIIPSKMEELVLLPGIGRKTANVILSEGFGVPALAVDTHVLRVANRLRLVSSLNPSIVESELKNLFPKELWRDSHLKLLFFGRYFCKAKNPNCLECPFKNICIK